MTAAHSAPTSAGPRTPSPWCPNSSGSLSSRRGADDRRGEQEGEAGGVLVGEPGEQAAAHRRARAREAGDQRERLRGADAERAAPAQRAGDRASSRVARARGRDRARAGAARSAPNSIRPLRNRKIAADCGEAKTLRSGCSSSRPSSPAGIVPTTSSQPSFASVSSGAISRSRSERPRPLHDPHPVAPEEPEQHERRGEVGGDQEASGSSRRSGGCSSRRGVGGHAVPEARDREQLREALEQAEDDRLEVGDRVHRAGIMCTGAIRAADASGQRPREGAARRRRPAPLAIRRLRRPPWARGDSWTIASPSPLPPRARWPRPRG